jgi:hypothetical protein
VSQVSLAAFAFLFSELVQYHQSRVSNINELERKCVSPRRNSRCHRPRGAPPARLEEAGHGVGSRMLDLLCARDKANRREVRLQGILQFVHTNVWRSLFGRVRRQLRRPGGRRLLTRR